MKQFLTFILLLFLSHTASAQDWCAWSFRYDFKIDSHYRGEYRFDSLSVAFNDEFPSTKFQKGELQYNDTTKVYSVFLEYGCISCGYADADQPPTIYVKLYLYDSFRKQHLSLMIPVVTDKVKLPVDIREIELGMNPPFPVRLDLGTIYYDDFIYFNPTIERYEGIRVNADGKAKYYKPGVYPYPPTLKLMEVR